MQTKYAVGAISIPWSTDIFKIDWSRSESLPVISIQENKFISLEKDSNIKYYYSNSSY